MESLPHYHKSGKTLLVDLSTTCRFCDESLPFYRKLVETNRRSGKNVNIVAVFKEDAIL